MMKKEVIIGALQAISMEKDTERGKIRRSRLSEHEKRLQVEVVNEQQAAVRCAMELIDNLMPERVDKTLGSQKSDINIKDEHLSQLRAE